MYKMSQQTSIDQLSGGVSDDDSRLVDSILNDINNSNSQPQQGNQGPPQQAPQQDQPSPEQIKMMQQQAQQQQMAQQQMAARQHQLAMEQQALAANQPKNIIQGGNENRIIDNVKLEAKNIMTVITLCVLLNVEQVDNLFKSQSIFITENGLLNMQGVIVKALLIGVCFYLIKTYLL